MLSAIIGAGYAQLVLSCHISTLLNVLHLTLHLFSDTLLYDHMVTSYVASYYALCRAGGIGPAAPVLAGPVILKVKAKFHFCKRQVINKVLG